MLTVPHLATQSYNRFFDCGATTVDGGAVYLGTHQLSPGNKFMVRPLATALCARLH